MDINTDWPDSTVILDFFFLLQYSFFVPRKQNMNKNATRVF